MEKDNKHSAPRRVQHFSHKQPRAHFKYVEQKSGQEKNSALAPAESNGVAPSHQHQQQQQQNHQQHHQQRRIVSPLQPPPPQPPPFMQSSSLSPAQQQAPSSQKSAQVAGRWVAPILPVQAEDVECIICCNRISVHTVHEKCDHDAVCWKCTLTNRILNGELFCCVCKVHSDTVILTAQPHCKKFAHFFAQSPLSSSSSSSHHHHQEGVQEGAQEEQELQQHHHSLQQHHHSLQQHHHHHPHSPPLLRDPEFGVLTDDPGVLQAIEELRALRCRVCNDKQLFHSLGALKAHLSQRHGGLAFCPHCLQSRKVFLSEQKMYGRRELAVHMALGEQDERGIIRGHPLCRFCDTRFYTDEDLFKHMNVHHLECNICKRDGTMYNYYCDYGHLEDHFREKHFLCENERCLALKWVVFGSVLDLKAHELREHATPPPSSSSRKGHGRGGNSNNAQVQLVLFSGATPFHHHHHHSASSMSTTNNSGASSLSQQQQQQQQQQRVRRPADVDSSYITFAGTTGNRFDPEMQAIQADNEFQSKKGGKRKNKQRAFFKDKHGENRDFEYQGASSIQQQESAASDQQKQRNTELIAKMKDILSPKQFDKFRKTSVDFQKGSLLSSEYYKVFASTFGERADELFDDLIATMPEKDKMKRDALQLARSMFHSKEFGEREPTNGAATVLVNEAQKSKKKSPKATVPAGNTEWPTLSGAPSNPIWVPQQQSSGSTNNGLVVSKKKSPHLLNEQDFPALPVATPLATVKKGTTAKLPSQQPMSSVAASQPVEIESDWPQNVNLIIKKKKKKS